MATDASKTKVAAHTAYLASVLPLGRKPRILDIGANPANVPPYAALRDANLAEVHGFEPGPEAFARLVASARVNETYHPEAVGSGDDATFYLTSNGSFASLFRPDVDQVEALGHWSNSLSVVQSIQMRTCALDDLPNLPKPDLLKMDVQGAELAILGSGTSKLADTVVIVPEIRFFRLYEGEPMMGAVDMKLRYMGFMLHKILPGAVVRLASSRIDQLRPAMTRNQMVDADAIYIRDIAKPGLMSVEQIARLALFADSVFVSVDLVLRCLDLLVARNALDESFIDEYIRRLPANYRARS